MKHNIAIEDIKKILLDDDCYYGIRSEDFEYQVGNSCHKSHQLFQDPMYDENDELIYPYCEDGIYEGYYDGGELGGTCVIEIKNNDDSIQSALNKIENYFGKYIYLIKGEYEDCGYDEGEIIINNAVVIGKFERYKRLV